MKFETAKAFLEMANAELAKASQEGERDVNFAECADDMDAAARGELEAAIKEAENK